jgi:hypothetical protein
VTDSNTTTVKLAKDVHEAIKREKERRPGMSLQGIVDEVIRTGLRVKRIPIEEG